MTLLLWGNTLQDVLKKLKITIPEGTSRDLLHWARNLYFTSSPNSVCEKVAIVVWDYCVKEELVLISSFEEAVDLYTWSRPTTPERIEVFNTLLQYVDTRNKAQFVVDLVRKDTIEARLANKKLAEF